MFKAEDFLSLTRESRRVDLGWGQEADSLRLGKSSITIAGGRGGQALLDRIWGPNES